MPDVEFGTKPAADAARDEYDEHLCSDDDKRTKTVTLVSDVPQSVLDTIQTEALESTATEDKTSQTAELTQKERDRISKHDGFTKHATTYSWRSGKGVFAREGLTSLFFDAIPSVGDYQDPQEGAEAWVDQYQSTGGGGSGRDQGAEDAKQQERAAQASRTAQSEGCDHARDHCEHGDPEACTYLQETCGYSESEVEEILGMGDVRDDDDTEQQELVTVGGGEYPEMDVTPQAAGALRDSWSGYKGATSDLEDAVETARTAVVQARQAFAAVNRIRESGGQDDLHPNKLHDLLEALEGMPGDIPEVRTLDHYGGDSRSSRSSSNAGRFEGPATDAAVSGSTPKPEKVPPGEPNGAIGNAAAENLFRRLKDEMPGGNRGAAVWHVKNAFKSSATEEQIYDAILAANWVVGRAHRMWPEELIADAKEANAGRFEGPATDAAIQGETPLQRPRANRDSDSLSQAQTDRQRNLRRFDSVATENVAVRGEGPDPDRGTVEQDTLADNVTDGFQKTVLSDLEGFGEVTETKIQTRVGTRTLDGIARIYSSPDRLAHGSESDKKADRRRIKEETSQRQRGTLFDALRAYVPTSRKDHDLAALGGFNGDRDATGRFADVDPVEIPDKDREGYLLVSPYRPWTREAKKEVERFDVIEKIRNNDLQGNATFRVRELPPTRWRDRHEIEIQRDPEIVYETDRGKRVEIYTDPDQVIAHGQETTLTPTEAVEDAEKNEEWKLLKGNPSRFVSESDATGRFADVEPVDVPDRQKWQPGELPQNVGEYWKVTGMHGPDHPTHPNEPGAAVYNGLNEFVTINEVRTGNGWWATVTPDVETPKPKGTRLNRTQRGGSDFDTAVEAAIEYMQNATQAWARQQRTVSQARQSAVDAAVSGSTPKPSGQAETSSVGVWHVEDSGREGAMWSNERGSMEGGTEMVVASQDDDGQGWHVNLGNMDEMTSQTWYRSDHGRDAVAWGQSFVESHPDGLPVEYYDDGDGPDRVEIAKQAAVDAAISGDVQLPAAPGGGRRELPTPSWTADDVLEMADVREDTARFLAEKYDTPSQVLKVDSNLDSMGDKWQDMTGVGDSRAKDIRSALPQFETYTGVSRHALDDWDGVPSKRGSSETSVPLDTRSQSRVRSDESAADRSDVLDTSQQSIEGGPEPQSRLQGGERGSRGQGELVEEPVEENPGGLMADERDPDDVGDDTPTETERGGLEAFGVTEGLRDADQQDLSDLD